MICRLLRNGRGCVKFDPQYGCSVYPRGGMQFRDRQGYCPIPDDGPNKPKMATRVKRRVGQQKHKRIKQFVLPNNQGVTSTGSRRRVLVLLHLFTFIKQTDAGVKNRKEVTNIKSLMLWLWHPHQYINSDEYGYRICQRQGKVINCSLFVVRTDQCINPVDMVTNKKLFYLKGA